MAGACANLISAAARSSTHPSTASERWPTSSVRSEPSCRDGPPMATTSWRVVSPSEGTGGRIRGDRPAVFAAWRPKELVRQLDRRSCSNCSSAPATWSSSSSRPSRRTGRPSTWLTWVTSCAGGPPSIATVPTLSGRGWCARACRARHAPCRGPPQGEEDLALTDQPRTWCCGQRRGGGHGVGRVVVGTTVVVEVRRPDHAVADYWGTATRSLMLSRRTTDAPGRVLVRVSTITTGARVCAPARRSPDRWRRRRPDCACAGRTAGMR